jgi:hypothetical protein
MVNIQSRRLMYTQVMTLLAKAKGGRRRAPRKSAAMPPAPAAAGSSTRNALAGTVVSLIFSASSTFHENRPIAVRIAKSGSSMNIKSYQLIASMIGLSTLLAQILFSINPQNRHLINRTSFAWHRHRCTARGALLSLCS